MKIILTVILLSAMVLLPHQDFAQSDCNPYFLLKEGKKWTTASYNSKDKYQGKQTFHILSISESGNSLSAKVLLSSYDKKDKLQMEKEVEFACEDGVIKMDMAQYMPQEMMESFKEMEVEMDFEDLQIPQSLEVGQYLEDGAMNMTISGPMTMKFGVRMTDRKVMDKESITVPAGTYDTYKINAIIKFDAMGTTRETKNVEWIAREVGAVRTESYDKNGKLTNYTVLTEYSE
ncbi:hypothetical protein JKA74_00155 [Marivirga sp. S37H4]|uniref:DUF3108 domain-containing protein n=1 Tax=Marivirga aurantiaca TaxID=2802615 RepID=A0A935C5Z1_9BACT|nr:hypothetical protein [Marivirga aurantiaca]MBK6263427.1 hypothetical protein [Marivirga aurantiaca]